MNRGVPILLACSLAGAGTAQTVLFDFDNAPLHTSLPLDVTVDTLAAHLSAGFYNYSIQWANVLGFTPQGFGGFCIYPNTVYKEDLLIGFSQRITDFSIMYSPCEYGADASATMRVTAYLDNALVGTATTTAPNPGTWPTGTLSYSSIASFNRVVIHYDAPPAGGAEDWGPIFLADNMQVTLVPEPVSLVVIGLGVALMARRRKRR